MDLFLELAQPNTDGFSRWVSVSEFSGKYQELQLGNGGSWLRPSSSLAKKYKIEVDKSQSSGNSIDRIRLVGFNTKPQFNQAIRKDIVDALKNKPCVMCGIRGNSENTKIEIDHKDGRKNDLRVADIKSQRLEDFQPLCKADNDAKRQICKKCKETGQRWNAEQISGHLYSFYKGDAHYTEKLGCVGCYQYDPVAYRQECAKRIATEGLNKAK
ncbi:restriction endonuclease [Helicobacter mehlei]|uniref:Restriction endonuclease n=1 Tax=Helicobacter mehlei TaxID=2316080 RepID=A0A553V396_9HELI|nr:restriction endonuclease [Helicobacter mehlei]TSA86902.1 restriction endonuclease [Helicobacter mehlei]